MFWNRKKDGFFERSDLLKGNRHFTCHEFLESGDFLAGDSDGMVAEYSVSNEGEYYMRREFEAHKKGGVACLLMFNEHTLISGGDRVGIFFEIILGIVRSLHFSFKDGMVMSWDSARDFEKMSEASLPEGTGCARTIVPQKQVRI